jgi:hypothetical protein
MSSLETGLFGKYFDKRLIYTDFNINAILLLKYLIGGKDIKYASAKQVYELKSFAPAGITALHSCRPAVSGFSK